MVLCQTDTTVVILLVLYSVRLVHLNCASEVYNWLHPVIVPQSPCLSSFFVVVLWQRIAITTGVALLAVVGILAHNFASMVHLPQLFFFAKLHRNSILPWSFMAFSVTLIRTNSHSWDCLHGGVLASRFSSGFALPRTRVHAEPLPRKSDVLTWWLQIALGIVELIGILSSRVHGFVSASWFPKTSTPLSHEYLRWLEKQQLNKRMLEKSAKKKKSQHIGNKQTHNHRADSKRTRVQSTINK